MEKESAYLLRGLLILFILMIPTGSAAVNTSVEIDNSVPILEKPLPNVSCAKNASLENYYNLDNYFYDINGQELSYYYSGGENITVEITNRSFVSIYTNDEFEGTNEL